MIYIAPGISIDEDKLQFVFVRASGPGGQNVNKVATAVQMHFNIAEANLPDQVRERLIRLAGKRITENGELIVEAKRFRTQEQNRADAMARLVRLLQQAAATPRPRRQTRPTLASKQRRLESKRRNSQVKSLRRAVRNRGE